MVLVNANDNNNKSVLLSCFYIQINLPNDYDYKISIIREFSELHETRSFLFKQQYNNRYKTRVSDAISGDDIIKIN